MSEELHFWYSGKQLMIKLALAANPFRCDDGGHNNNYVTIDGEEFEYTECNESEEYTPNFDDAKYLGKATLGGVRLESI